MRDKVFNLLSFIVSFLWIGLNLAFSSDPSENFAYADDKALYIFHYEINEENFQDKTIDEIFKDLYFLYRRLDSEVRFQPSPIHNKQFTTIFKKFKDRFQTYIDHLARSNNPHARDLIAQIKSIDFENPTPNFFKKLLITYFPMQWSQQISLQKFMENAGDLNSIAQLTSEEPIRQLLFFLTLQYLAKSQPFGAGSDKVKGEEQYHNLGIRYIGQGYTRSDRFRDEVITSHLQEKFNGIPLARSAIVHKLTNFSEALFQWYHVIKFSIAPDLGETAQRIYQQKKMVLEDMLNSNKEYISHKKDLKERPFNYVGIERLENDLQNILDDIVLYIDNFLENSEEADIKTLNIIVPEFKNQLKETTFKFEREQLSQTLETITSKSKQLLGEDNFFTDGTLLKWVIYTSLVRNHQNESGKIVLLDDEKINFFKAIPSLYHAFQKIDGDLTHFYNNEFTRTVEKIDKLEDQISHYTRDNHVEFNDLEGELTKTKNALLYLPNALQENMEKLIQQKQPQEIEIIQNLCFQYIYALIDASHNMISSLRQKIVLPYRYQGVPLLFFEQADFATQYIYELNAPNEPKSRLFTLLGTRVSNVEFYAHVPKFYTMEEWIKKTKIIDFSRVRSHLNPIKDLEFVKSSTLLNNLHYQCNKRLSTKNQAVKFLWQTMTTLIQGFTSKLEQISTIKDHFRNNAVLENTFKLIVYKMTESLKTAFDHQHNFNEFYNSIDLIAHDLFSLTILKPQYSENEVGKLYEQHIKDIMPQAIQPYIQKAFPGHTALNTISGAYSGFKKVFKNIQIMFEESAYYEVVSLLRGVEEKAYESKDSNHILYFTVTYPNISVDPDMRVYKENDHIKNIHAILTQKPNGKVLVLLDDTLNYENSTPVHETLLAFQEEIKTGRLAFVIYRSGVKFDSLGFDHAYGAPLYLVYNNLLSDSSWEEVFQSFLKQSSPYACDPYSQQWFGLLYEFAPTAVDTYKTLIFKNAKVIFDGLPDEIKLQPKGDNYNENLNYQCRVVNLDPTFLPQYIDIRGDIGEDFERRLSDRKVYSIAKQGFGFAHINVDRIIDHEITRITPGMNPEENDIVINTIIERCLPNFNESLLN